MTLASDYEVKEPSRAEIDELQGAALLEFGKPMVRILPTRGASNP